MRSTGRGTGDLLLDTDVLSFFFNHDASRMPRYAAHLSGKLLYASFVSVAEMRLGAGLRGWRAVR